MLKYLDNTEFFGRIEKEYPRSRYIIKTGPSKEHITVYDKQCEYEPLVIAAETFIKTGERLGFSWRG